MYSIEYKNGLGKVCLCGGTQPLLSPLSIQGLGLPQKEASVAIFAGQSGQKLTGSRDLARSITISGHVYCDYTHVAKACRILYSPGQLIFRSNRGAKCIDARCTGVSDKKITENGTFYLTISFCCDNPYFKHPVEIVKEIYSRESRLSTHFTLPCVVSARIREGNCFNDGDIAAEPVLIVKNNGNAACTGFTVTNKTNGSQLVYQGEIPPGGQVILSVPERTVTDEFNRDLLAALREDCYLSDFSLAVGENRLVFEESSGEVQCTVQYNTSFVEWIM